MAKQIHKEFETMSPKGKEFIKLWNKEWRDGAQVRMAKRFNISVPTVYRIRKKLGLPDLFETPGRKRWEKILVRRYYKGESTLRLAEMYKMSSQGINIVLKKHNVEMRPQHVVNCTWFKTRQTKTTHYQLLNNMKRLYCDDKLTVVKTAKQLGIDPGTVTNKLRAMGIEIRLNKHQPMKGGYPCHWCNTIMEKVWQNKGPRKQKYCNSKCKNKAKDLRRMTTNEQRMSEPRLNMMITELKDNWGDDYSIAHKRLFDVKPIHPELTPTQAKEKSKLIQDKLNANADDWMKKWR